MDRRADVDLDKILSIVWVKLTFHGVYARYRIDRCVVLMGEIACKDSNPGPLNLNTQCARDSVTCEIRLYT